MSMSDFERILKEKEDEKNFSSVNDPIAPLTPATTSRDAASDQDLLKQYLLKQSQNKSLPMPTYKMYQDPAAIARAGNQGDDQRLMASIGSGINDLIKGATGFTPSNDTYQEMRANADKPLAIESDRQKQVRDYLKEKYLGGIKKLELEREGKALDAQISHQKAMEDLGRQELGLKTRVEGAKIPDLVKPAADELSKGLTQKVAIAQQIDSALELMQNVDDKQKLQIGRELLKVLNSTEGKDAIGAEEAKRLGGKLEFAYGNFLNSNPVQFGRDLEGFMKDAGNKSDVIKNTAKKNVDTYKSMTGKDFPITIPKTKEDGLSFSDPEKEKRYQEWKARQ